MDFEQCGKNLCPLCPCLAELRRGDGAAACPPSHPGQVSGGAGVGHGAGGAHTGQPGQAST